MWKCFDLEDLNNIRNKKKIIIILEITYTA